MDYIALRKKIIEKEFGGMNDRQFEAVTTVSGPLLVLAGAGSGKTTVLVNRIAYLVKYGNAYLSKKIQEHTEDDLNEACAYIEDKLDFIDNHAFKVDAPRPYEILAITFTNKAADELKERISAKLGIENSGVWAGTFHRICGQILRYNAERIGYNSHFTIYDSDDQKAAMKTILKKGEIDEKLIPIKSALSFISHCKDSLISADEALSEAGNDSRKKILCELYKEYQKQLKSSNAMDFDDMIVNTVNLFENSPDILDFYAGRFKYVMVDEYQDTNFAQYRLISLISSKHKNLCVVGDDDQSIYRFRGATIENILNFEDEFDNAKTIRLEQNYRSTSNILDAANEVISHNRARKGKNLWTDSGSGEKITVRTCFDDRSEAEYVTDEILKNVKNGDLFSENAVLYRMNAQSASIEQRFIRSGIAYTIIGSRKFFERKEIKDILAYLAVINNHNDAVRLKRIINVPKRGIGLTTINSAAEISDSTNISLFEVFKNSHEFAKISRASQKLSEFCEMIDNFTADAENLTVAELTIKVIEQTGYRDSLLSDPDDHSSDRIQNLEELVNTIRQFDEEHPGASLSDYLEDIALLTDTDNMEPDSNKVVLMTVHSAKGLEFKNVFLIGMEEGIFPGNMSILGGEAEIEEERRLAYVAITRAKKKLVITHTVQRYMYASTQRNLPSRFLDEIPDLLCEKSAEERSFFNSYSAGGGYSVQRSSSAFGNPDAGFAGGYKSKTSLKNSLSKTQAPANKNPVDCYKVGQTVEHSAFGTGIISAIVPTATDAMLTIEFEKVGTKKIMAGYAKLKIL